MTQKFEEAGFHERRVRIGLSKNVTVAPAIKHFLNALRYARPWLCESETKSEREREKGSSAYLALEFHEALSERAKRTA